MQNSLTLLDGNKFSFLVKTLMQILFFLVITFGPSARTAAADRAVDAVNIYQLVAYLVGVSQGNNFEPSEISKYIGFIAESDLIELKATTGIHLVKPNSMAGEFIIAMKLIDKTTKTVLFVEFVVMNGTSSSDLLSSLLKGAPSQFASSFGLQFIDDNRPIEPIITGVLK